MEEFYFQDNTLGVVDDWIKDVEDDGKPLIQTYDNTDTRKNYGLGYENKTKTKIEDKNDVLFERMTKQKKRKQEIKAVGDDITHGIVEEEILSRVPSGKKRKLPQEESKPQTERKQASENPIQASEQFNSKSQPVESGEVFNGEEQRPKRIKTRSKQKNIRRDKRAAEFKPSHLQVGSKDYKGRPLTPETKAILGLPPKKPQNNKRKKDKFQST